MLSVWPQLSVSDFGLVLAHGWHGMPWLLVGLCLQNCVRIVGHRRSPGIECWARPLGSARAGCRYGSTTVVSSNSGSYPNPCVHVLSGTMAALFFRRGQRAQARTCSPGRCRSITSHSDQSCAPTRQNSLLRMCSPDLCARRQRAQVRTCSLGRCGSRTFHPDQSCPPTRQTGCLHIGHPTFIAVLLMMPRPAEVRRVRSGPGRWPGPCRQARWVARGSAGKGGS
jgi:hypothetical protein